MGSERRPGGVSERITASSGKVGTKPVEGGNVRGCFNSHLNEAHDLCGERIAGGGNV